MSARLFLFFRKKGFAKVIYPSHPLLKSSATQVIRGEAMTCGRDSCAGAAWHREPSLDPATLLPASHTRLPLPSMPT
jgi:hypothetical protein